MAITSHKVVSNSYSEYMGASHETSGRAIIKSKYRKLTMSDSRYDDDSA